MPAARNDPLFSPLATARTPRGVVVVEIACAIAVQALLVSVTAVAVAQIANQRRAILHHAIGQQAVANVLEEVDSWPAAATTPERLQGLALPAWAARQLPRAALHCHHALVKDENLGNARITVTVAWHEAPQRSASRIEAVLWKPGFDQELSP